MITELLTPIILASAPAIVEVDTSAKYSHEKQIVEARMDSKAIGYGTISGTQTYMPNGQPFDSDND